MPISTFLGVQTALRGILAQQRALDVTSHNIANANTVGFSRREAVLSPSEPFTTVNGQLGTGVDVEGYRRIRDNFLDVQLRAQTMRSGFYRARQDGLDQIEGSVREPSDSGLGALLGRYWSSWQDVVNAPENIATRQTLAQNAAALADGFQTLSSQLQTVASQANTNIGLTIDEVNSVSTRVAALNGSIILARSAGSEPSDLLDERDVLLDRLNELGNTTTSEAADGSATVQIGGFTTVSGIAATSISALSDLTSLTSGKLAGLKDLRDVTVPGYVTDLDALAGALITATNTQHALGYDLAGTFGTAFFTGTTAADIAVSAGIVADPSLIAAAGAAGAPGDSTNALALAGLRRTALVSGATVDTAYSQLITRLGSDAQETRRQSANTKALADSLEGRRQSVSGVSLDEEMTNLIRYQRGFQASARALTAMDEMIDLLINRTGRVGM